jgi:hypothetical protein
MMYHNREEVIARTIQEFELLDHLIENLSNEDWDRLLLRPESKDPWTVKDAVTHITHWKADKARLIRGQPYPPDQRGLGETEENRLIFLRWHDHSPQEVLAWHRQVQEDVLVTLREAPEEWFSDRQHRPEWPYDLDGHSAFHRVKDIQRALKTRP